MYEMKTQLCSVIYFLLGLIPTIPSSPLDRFHVRFHIFGGMKHLFNADCLMDFYAGCGK